MTGSPVVDSFDLRLRAETEMLPRGPPAGAGSFFPFVDPMTALMVGGGVARATATPGMRNEIVQLVLQHVGVDRSTIRDEDVNVILDLFAREITAWTQAAATTTTTASGAAANNAAAGAAAAHGNYAAVSPPNDGRATIAKELAWADTRDLPSGIDALSPRPRPGHAATAAAVQHTPPPVALGHGAQAHTAAAPPPPLRPAVAGLATAAGGALGTTAQAPRRLRPECVRPMPQAPQIVLLASGGAKLKRPSMKGSTSTVTRSASSAFSDVSAGPVDATSSIMSSGTSGTKKAS